MLRARGTLDRDYAKPLDVAAPARVAHVSVPHFSRTFRAAFGESPTDYRRRGPLADVPTCFAMAWMRPRS
ncbi:helix-turn-helix transcriptional regulator [Amycolatopsis sp. NPDC051106]|uniref:helix-turn-helix transcriptional regulator n=1 Tax=unclassified Amycolatopsis TaxID=2618356 RepID=UPI00343AC355